MASATRLFVSNLPKNTDQNALKDIFSSYGEITNFDLKSKPGVENDTKIFAFVTISTTNFNVESCIKHFSNEEFQGHKLYVTRARESFLERLQREREQTQSKASKPEQPISIPEINFQNITQNIHKRKLNDLNQFDNNDNKITRPSNKPENYDKCNKKTKISKTSEHFNGNLKHVNSFNTNNNNVFLNDEKKMNADKKRLESIKKKRQEFSAKKNIIKTGLTSIDKQQNKKVIFSDNEDASIENSTNKSSIETKTKQKPSLFDDGGSDDEINFDIKKQFEGKKGQKVLDLQSKYKSDKRFVLDERFVEDESASEEEDDGKEENVELGQANEKTKQLDILQNLLGVTIKTKSSDTSNKKPKLDMLRFDPSQPEHAKYFAPINKPEPTKTNKVKETKEEKPDQIVEKIEVSKEQFYKVTDDLKDAMNQSKEFSLRSLFARDVQNDVVEEHNDVISLKTKKKEKVKNPLQVTEKNPFVYDSSDSENEEETHKVVEENVKPETIETKTFWRENLFFTNSDNRLKEGLLFFSNSQYNEFQKDRRELKSLMKKRIYNKERKNTMFQKKIGGRKKTIKQKFKKN